MKCLTLKEYQRLVADSKVLEQDKHGAKVLETVDNKIVKLFRRKRAITSAAFKPYAARFVENAQRLKARGIKTVNIEAVYRCSPISRTLVVYRPVPGQTLRDAIRNSTNPDTLMAHFASFFAELHDKGVLFRSIHLNNVIVPSLAAANGHERALPLRRIYLSSPAVGQLRQALPRFGGRLA